MEMNTTEDDAALQASFENLEPIDVPSAEKGLKEIKQIMDGMGIPFFLHSGVCLGAIRDNGIMPWDDDLDIGVVIGLNGFTEEVIPSLVSKFRENGFAVSVIPQDHHISVPLLKDKVRTDLQCHFIVNEQIYHFPGILLPLRLFTDLKEIDFLGDKHLVPNPPEEYLRLKYGEDWVTPKAIGQYEKDVMDLVPEGPLPGRAGKLKQYIITRFMPWRAARIRVLDFGGRPVAGAEVVVAGFSRARTNSKGYAKLYIPYNFIFALSFSFGGHDEVLYEERLVMGKALVYRADAQVKSGRNFILTPENG